MGKKRKIERLRSWGQWYSKFVRCWLVTWTLTDSINIWLGNRFSLESKLIEVPFIFEKDSDLRMKDVQAFVKFLYKVVLHLGTSCVLVVICVISFTQTIVPERSIKNSVFIFGYLLFATNVENVFNIDEEVALVSETVIFKNIYLSVLTICLKRFLTFSTPSFFVLLIRTVVREIFHKKIIFCHVQYRTQNEIKYSEIASSVGNCNLI